MGLLAAVPEQRVHLPQLPCCFDGTLCRKHERDELYRKPMRIVWSLSSADSGADWPEISPERWEQIKEIVRKEAAMIYKREHESEQWERFKA